MEETMPNLSDIKKAELKAAFDLFDTNGNGKIPYIQVGDIFRRIGQDPSQQELIDMVKEVIGSNQIPDADGVTFEKFTEMMRVKMRDTETMEELIEAFRVFDSEGKGLINNYDLKQQLINLGDGLSPDEIEKLIYEADEDKDGYINYEEFVINLMTEKKRNEDFN